MKNKKNKEAKIKKEKKVKKAKPTKVKKSSLNSNQLFKKRAKFVVAEPTSTSQLIHLLFKGYNKTLDIFQIGDDEYSVCFEYTDISFSKAQAQEQLNIFKHWVDYLNSFSEKSHIQVINIGRPVQRESFKDRFMYNEKKDWTDNECKIAEEFNTLIERSITSENEKLETRRYIVISQHCESIQQARDIFYEYEIKTDNKFRELKSRLRRVTIEETLELIYDFFRTTPFLQEKKGPQDTLISRINEEKSIFDILAPESLDFSKRDYFKSGDKYYRILYLSEIKNSTSPVFYNKLTNLDMDIIVTLNIQPNRNSQMIKKVDKIISGVKTERLGKVKNALKSGYPYEAVMDEKLEEKLSAYSQLKVDLQKNGQKLFTNNMLICVMGKSEDDINVKTNKIIDLAAERVLEISALQYQQIEGLINLLPLGHNTIQLKRNLTSEATAANVPFNTKDLMYPESLFFGINLISRNAVFADRKKLLNGNGCILATAGAGKSFSVKSQIEQIMLRYPDDDVVIIDPQNEYGPLLNAFDGQLVEISPTSNTYINPFDLDLNYDDKSPVKAKTEYVIAFVESIVEGELTGAQKTIIDRCTKIAFEKYEMSGFKDKSVLPNLPLFYELLKQQPEEDAKDLALVIERYVKGALDIFAKDTNVNINNRLVCFDISQLSSSMQTTGYLVVLDFIMNRLSANRASNKNTWLFIDEFHILLANQYSAEYIAKIYKVGRKYLALPTIITQNIADVINNEQGRKILSNSEFALILKQKPLDLPDIQAIFEISNEEAGYVMDPPAGQGILCYAGDRVVFRNEVPKDFYIYSLNQTSTTVREST